MNNNVVLKAVGLQKSYKEGGRLLHVLKDVNLEVHEGESVAIVGTSGSGKTTLLQCIGGLDRFDKGLIEIGGENIAELSEQRLTELRNRKLGFVYQFHHLRWRHRLHPLPARGGAGRDRRRADRRRGHLKAFSPAGRHRYASGRQRRRLPAHDLCRATVERDPDRGQSRGLLQRFII